MNVTPISEDQPSSFGCATIGIYGLGLAFFGMGSLFLFMTIIRPFWLTQTSSDWVQTECTITSSKIDNEDGETYRPVVSYTYTIDGDEFQSKKFDFTELNRSLARCEVIVSRFAAGDKIQCYYDPENPTNAVIEKHFDFSWLGFLLPQFFVIIGLGLLLGPFFARTKTDNSISGSITSQSEPGFLESIQTGLSESDLANGTHKTHPRDIEDQQWDKPQKLKQSNNRIARFVGALIAALLWNLLIGYFLYSQLAEGIDNGFDWIPLLFLVPFAFVGIGIIASAIYCFAAIFNPTIELAMSTGAVVQGDSFDVAWQLNGKASSVKVLTVFVQGEEIAVYQRGTDTITDRSVFCDIKVTEVTDPQMIQFGSKAVTIPKGTMHSFSSDHNTIAWHVVVKGEIPWWPDVEGTFEFRVKP